MGEKELIIKKPEEISETPFWTEKKLKIFDLYVEGNSVGKIAKQFGIKTEKILDIITEPIFIERYESYIKDTFLRKHKIAHEIIELLWGKVRKNIDEIKPGIALRELKNLLVSMVGEAKIKSFTAKQYKFEIKDPKALENHFGFKRLSGTAKSERKKHERSKDIKLDNKERDSNK